MGSSRLPGKVLKDLAGAPMLARVLTRLARAETVDRVVVATTVEPADEAVVGFCTASGWTVIRGSETDVLDRYHRAFKAHPAEAIVRITGDCPLVDPGVVDEVVGAFWKLSPDVSYVSNVVPLRTYPHGLDVEVFSAAALERAWRDDANPAWREHVTPYLYRRSDLFRTHCVTRPVDDSTVRWTVDTQADFDRVSCIYDYFGTDTFTWEEALIAEAAHPEWALLNCDVMQRSVA